MFHGFLVEAEDGKTFLLLEDSHFKEMGLTIRVRALLNDLIKSIKTPRDEDIIPATSLPSDIQLVTIIYFIHVLQSVIWGFLLVIEHNYWGSDDIAWSQRTN